MSDSTELFFCEVFYYKASIVPDNWAEILHTQALKHSRDLDLLLTHFDFWPMDENCKSKGYRYIKRNQSKLKDLIKSTENKGAFFYCVGEDVNYFEAPMAISMLNEEPSAVGISKKGFETDYGIFVFQSKLENVLKNNSVPDLSMRILKDISLSINVKYGIVTVMEGRKYPGMYFYNSACSRYLDDDEEQEVTTWRMEGYRFDSIVRKIYWGNIISPGHWNNDKSKEKYLLTELKHECEGKVFWINDDILFFCAPFDISECETNKPKFQQFQKTIAHILTDIGVELLA